MLRIKIYLKMFFLFCHFFFQATSLINIMKGLGESIVHHIKYYVQLSHDDSKEKDIKPLKHKLSVHRMTVVNLATFLIQFLESLVPLEMVSTVLMLTK